MSAAMDLLSAERKRVGIGNSRLSVLISNMELPAGGDFGRTNAEHLVSTKVPKSSFRTIDILPNTWRKSFTSTCNHLS